MGRSVGRHFFFFFNIYYLHIEGNGKKKISDLKKKKMSSSKTGESVGNAKQTIFLFLAQFAMKFKRKIILD